MWQIGPMMIVVKTAPNFYRARTIEKGTKKIEVRQTQATRHARSDTSEG